MENLSLDHGKKREEREAAVMSVKKARSLNAGNGKSTKRASFGRFFSCKAIHLEEGKTLKEMDSKSIKAEIRRWAKAVAAYARQVSSRFTSPRG